ncbi:MAG: SLC13 family permease [Vicingaceae bacterium]
MSVDAIITIFVILVAFVLFATEKLSVDHVAIGIMVTFALTGVLTPTESFEGFANNATLIVAAMFVLGNALIKTGIIESIGPFFTKLMSTNHHRSIFSLTFISGSISAFINNTPVVATFIPVITNAARKTGKQPSKYLIPLSFGAIFGGSCTLIGTSTNLLVDGIAESNGLEGFHMFLFAPLGLIFFLVGITYLVIFSKRLLPERAASMELVDDSSVKDYLTEIKVIGRLNEYKEGEEKAEESIGINDVFEEKKEGEVIVEQLVRDGKIIRQPELDFKLKENDVLLVRGDLARIKKILNNELLEMSESFGDLKFPEEETKAIEIVIMPNSHLVNRKLENLDFFDRYNARVLAIRHRGKQKINDLGNTILQAGDVLLLQTNNKGFEMLYKAERKRRAPFLSLSESGIDKINSKSLITVGAIIALVIALASLNIVPLVVGAFGGIFLLVLSGIISMENAYKSIDWRVIFLLAGALSLGAAMNKTGLSEQLASLIQSNIAENFGPIAVVSALYLTTSILTEVMSNNAAAALLAPIAISLSHSMGLSPIPFLMAITFAGSASFMTPIGYQTNTMVYSVGNYTFKDFFRIGFPLNLLFWILATILIPVIYPF